MTTDNDERDDNSADDDGLVCIGIHVLGALFAATGERIDFEDHGHFAVVLSEDLAQLRKLAFELAQEYERS